MAVPIDVQWAHLDDGRVLVASPSRARVIGAGTGTVRPLRPDTDRSAANVATTAQLLDGAIALAEGETPTAPLPPLTRVRWAWQLVGQWYCAHHSLALLPELIARYEQLGRVELCAYAQRKLAEESGHDALALNDLTDLGYDAPGVLTGLPPPDAVIELIAYAATLVDQRPVEFIGYVYALERRILRVDGEWLERLAALLAPSGRGASFVRAHALEFDDEHVAEATALISSLPAAERAGIVSACHRTTEICCRRERGGEPSDAELAAVLGRFHRGPTGPGNAATLLRAG